ncbi:MAG TPA: histidine kinase [Pseudidiomarina sp.]|nr:histidine kinase [Pseudidiomarina sp.]
MNKWLQKFHQYFGLDRFAAFITWLLVSASALWFLAVNDSFSMVHIAGTAALMVLFFVLFEYATTDEHPARTVRQRAGSVIAQYGIIIACYFLVPFNYVAIYAVVWSAQIPYFMPFNRAVALSVVWTLPLWLIYGYYWNVSGSWLTAVLFWTFNLFAMMTMQAQLTERKARAEVEAVNRELRSTQALLAAASKQDERLRISRNIHDLLGHHLTALTINLQIASHKTTGEAREQVERCHAIAKLLLADVREAVSEIRDSGHLKLCESLQQLATTVTPLQVQVVCDEPIEITDLSLAETVLRTAQEAITNTLKHSYATQMTIILKQADDQLRLDISDNGKAAVHITPGNGLLGMRERWAAIGGDCTVDSSAGFLRIAAQARLDT